MNAIAQQVHAAILAKAQALITTLPVSLEPPTRTEQFAALDVFFAKDKFGCNQAAVVELVGIMNGYKPVPPLKITAEPFTIVFCGHHKIPWIVLSDTHGFAALDSDTFHIDEGCERVATQAEGAAFLKDFAEVDPDQFFAWVKTKYSQGSKWILDL